jgi:hypothetical protein
MARKLKPRKPGRIPQWREVATVQIQMERADRDAIIRLAEGRPISTVCRELLLPMIRAQLATPTRR